MVLDGVGEAGLGVPRGEVAPAAAASGGGGVPVREGRRRLVGELRGEVGDRFRGLSRAEEGRGGVLHGELRGGGHGWRRACSGRRGRRGAGSWLWGKGGSGEANFDFAREWIGDDLSGGEMARHGGTATVILVRRSGQGTAGRVSRSRGARGSGFERNRVRARWFGRGRDEGAARG